MSAFDISLFSMGMIALQWVLCAIQHQRLLRLEQELLCERERCVRIAEEQPYFPDTHTGVRQQWVKDQIAEKIRGGA